MKEIEFELKGRPHEIQKKVYQRSARCIQKMR